MRRIWSKNKPFTHLTVSIQCVLDLASLPNILAIPPHPVYILQHSCLVSSVVSLARDVSQPE